MLEGSLKLNTRIGNNTNTVFFFLLIWKAYGGTQLGRCIFLFLGCCFGWQSNATPAITKGHASGAAPSNCAIDPAGAGHNSAPSRRRLPRRRLPVCVVTHPASSVAVGRHPAALAANVGLHSSVACTPGGEGQRCTGPVVRLLLLLLGCLQWVQEGWLAGGKAAAGCAGIQGGALFEDGLCWAAQVVVRRSECSGLQLQLLRPVHAAAAAAQQATLQSGEAGTPQQKIE